MPLERATAKPPNAKHAESTFFGDITIRPRFAWDAPAPLPTFVRLTAQLHAPKAKLEFGHGNHVALP